MSKLVDKTLISVKTIINTQYNANNNVVLNRMSEHIYFQPSCFYSIVYFLSS